MTIRVVVPILVGQLQPAAAAAVAVDVIIVVARHRRHQPPSSQIFQPFRRGGLCHEDRRRAVGG